MTIEQLSCYQWYIVDAFMATESYSKQCQWV